MEQELLKREMMKLWKETFHDSDEYVKLIFDNYFRAENVAYRVDEDGNLVSALLGVPYRFCGFSSEKECGELKGMYLCGLATKENRRGEGIMSDLLEEMNIQAKSEKYDFTFLIPANGGLEKYYFDRGYVDCFYRNEFHYTSLHDFRNELKQTDAEKLIDFDTCKVSNVESDIDEKEFEKIATFIRDKEKNERVVSLIHAYEDLKIAFKERFISGGKIFVVKDENGLINGIAFCGLSGEKDVKIDYLLFDSLAQKYKLLSEIKNHFSDKSISLFRCAEIAQKGNQSLWNPFYIGSPSHLPNIHQIGILEEEEDVKEMSKPHGMIRLLDSGRIIDYVASLNNFLTGEERDKMKSDMKGYEKYGIKTLEEFLFRHPQEDDVIYCMMNFPRLPMRMGLMLD